MSCLLTNNINFCDLSKGGVKKLYLTNKSFISGAAYTSDDLSTILDFIPAFGVGLIWWLEFDVNADSTLFAESLVKGDRGNVYKIDLDTAFVSLGPEKREVIEQLIKGKLVAVVEDNNGYFWSLGEVEGLEVVNYNSTSDTTGGVNRYTITLTTYQSEKIKAVDITAVSNFWVAVEDCSIYAGLPISAIPPPLAAYFDCLIDFS